MAEIRTFLRSNGIILMILPLLTVFSSCLGENDLIETTVPSSEEQSEEQPEDDGEICVGIAYKCIENVWEIKKRCDRHEKCVVNDGLADCRRFETSDSCITGRSICIDGTAYSCNEGSWVLKEKCFLTKKMCVETPEGAECNSEPSSVREICTGEVKKVCLDNMLHECMGKDLGRILSDCNKARMLCSIEDEKCVEFESNECDESKSSSYSLCRGKDIVSCSDGVWKVVDSCEVNEKCLEFASVAACYEDKKGTSCK